ncbi:uncharacterized protein LOC144926086 [Branchiostoma floridae x Branchiostoma belcheri]
MTAVPQITTAPVIGFRDVGDSKDYWIVKNRLGGNQYRLARGHGTATSSHHGAVISLSTAGVLPHNKEWEMWKLQHGMPDATEAEEYNHRPVYVKIPIKIYPAPAG